MKQNIDGMIRVVLNGCVHLISFTSYLISEPEKYSHLLGQLSSHLFIGPNSFHIFLTTFSLLDETQRKFMLLNDIIHT